MTEPHKRILREFHEVWKEEMDLDDVGRILVGVSYCLGRTVVELHDRGVPWDVIDRNIRRSMVRGVDATIGHENDQKIGKNSLT